MTKPTVSKQSRMPNYRLLRQVVFGIMDGLNRIGRAKRKMDSRMM